MNALRATQRWFAAIVTGAAAAGPGVRRIASGGALDARERLGIHTFGYMERLRGVLANDYPAVQHAVGAARFARLVAAYVRAHPSRHPNLNQLGAKFPAFLARRRPGARVSEFVVDLAAFELAIARAHETECVPSLDPESLQNVALERRHLLRLQLQPSACIATTRHDVATWYEAWTRGDAGKRARSRRSWFCVHRHGATIVRRVLDRREFVTLRAIARGVPIGAALAQAKSPTAVAGWFRDLARSGLFVAPPQGARRRR